MVVPTTPPGLHNHGGMQAELTLLLRPGWSQVEYRSAFTRTPTACWTFEIQRSHIGVKHNVSRQTNESVCRAVGRSLAGCKSQAVTADVRMTSVLRHKGEHLRGLRLTSRS